MGRVRGVAAALAITVVVLLAGCVDADQFSYESALSAVDPAAVATPTVMPAALTEVAAKKAAPIPKPAYSRTSRAKIPSSGYRRPRPPFNQPAIYLGTRDGVPMIWDPDGPP